MSADEARADFTIFGELTPGERLLWVGRPAQGFHLGSLQPAQVGVGAILLLLALVWQGVIFSGPLATGGALPVLRIYRTFQLLFVLIAIFAVVGPAILDLLNRRQTVYGLTARRVLIVGGLTARRVRSLPLAGLADVSFSERRDGRGTIAFGPTGVSAVPAFVPWWISVEPPTRLERIADARRVYELILQAQAAMAQQRLDALRGLGL